MQTNSENIYSQPPTYESGNGNTGTFFVGNVTELLIGIDVTAISGANSLVFYVEYQGADETWYPAYTSAAITATGLTNDSIGAGLHDAQSFGSLVRIRWAQTGNATFSLSLEGK